MYDHLGLFRMDRLLDRIDVEDPVALEFALDRVAPTAVINCVGLVKQVPAGQDAMRVISVNALLPHRLEALCRERDVRLVHISTDCVFSGDRGLYREDDTADARDLYGRSKLLGEVQGARSLTVRTSIIGRELSSSHGLLEWFLSQRGPSVPGFTRAIFSGFPTTSLARIIASIVRDHRELSGLYHISSDPISKYDLLLLLRDAYGTPVQVQPSGDIEIDRSLLSDRFQAATGCTPGPWPALVAEMASDPTPYEQWRKVHSASR